MIYFLILFITGLLQGVMISLDGQLGQWYTLMGVSFFVHGVGLVLLAAYLLLVQRRKIRLRGAPRYVYLVGLMGMAIVASSSYGTLHLGATVSLALSVAGQMLVSVLIDQFGWFSLPKRRFQLRQLPAYLLVAAGTLLVVLA